MKDLVDRQEARRVINRRIWDRELDGTQHLRNHEALEIDHLISELPNNVNEILDKLIERYDYCLLMESKNLKVDFTEQATLWRERASGVRDAIEILKGELK